METAGLVLATLPLIISCLEHYNEGLKPLKDFVNYRETIERLANDLLTQKWELSHTCERLVVCLIQETLCLVTATLDNEAHHSFQPPVSADQGCESIYPRDLVNHTSIG